MTPADDPADADLTLGHGRRRTSLDDRRVIAVTGATDGLGLALAHRLARRTNTLLILHGRRPDRLAALRNDLANRPADVTTVSADLADLAQVRTLAGQIAHATDHLNVLVNNAGVAPPVQRTTTTDGHELAFGVNYLAPFALTRELLPVLRAGAPARVINVAALGQTPIDLEDLRLDHDYSARRAYRQSKFALVADGLTLAEQLPPDEVTVNSLHPGTSMPTTMVLMNGGRAVDTIASGVDAVLRLVDDPELASVTGRFYDRQAEASVHPAARDQALRRRLLARSTELVQQLP